MSCDPSPSAAPPPPLAMADCAVSTDMLGEAGTEPSAFRPGRCPRMAAAAAAAALSWWWCAAAAAAPSPAGNCCAAATTGGRRWHVAEEMADAREIGMRQRPFPAGTAWRCPCPPPSAWPPAAPSPSGYRSPPPPPPPPVLRRSPRRRLAPARATQHHDPTRQYRVVVVVVRDACSCHASSSSGTKGSSGISPGGTRATVRGSSHQPWH